MPRSASAGASSRERHPVQRAERVTRGERAGGSGDQRVHLESRHTCHSRHGDGRSYALPMTTTHRRTADGDRKAKELEQ